MKGARLSSWRSCAGVTLVELVCVLGLLGVIGTIVVHLFNLGAGKLSWHTHHYEGSYGARWVLHWIEKDVRRGRSVQVVNNQELSCQVLLLDTHGKYNWVSVHYRLDGGGNVQRQEGFDTKPLASGIESLTFGKETVLSDYPNVHRIRVAIKQKPNSRNSQSFVEHSTEIVPRSELP